MKVYFREQDYSIYTTDEHVRNLQLIEINSIKEYVWDYSLDLLAILSEKYLSKLGLMKSRFEIMTDDLIMKTWST